jgi:hypothetical protein
MDDAKRALFTIFDRCVDSVQHWGTPVDSAEGRAELAEQLCCAAALEFFRARDEVPALADFDARVFARAAGGGRDERDAAVKMLDNAVESMLQRARYYRSVRLDDLMHLRLQSEADRVVPQLELSASLIRMAG